MLHVLLYFSYNITLRMIIVRVEYVQYRPELQYEDNNALSRCLSLPTGKKQTLGVLRLGADTEYEMGSCPVW